MTRSPNSLVPSASGQPETETRDDKALSCRQEGEANLYMRCRLYQMVGRVSHLPGLRRMPPDEDGRRAGWGQSPRPVR